MPTAIINAQLVLPPEYGLSRDATLRFDKRRILSIDQPPRRGETVLDLAGRAIYPGLINAHDHLELNHFPRSKFREVYANAHQWSLDFSPRLHEEPYYSLRTLPLAVRCHAGIDKNLRSGVTMVAHHNPLHRPLRHADIRVLLDYGWAHSMYNEPNISESYRRTPRNTPWMIHLAEGTDETAAAELDELSRLGCLQSNTVMIHGVGLSETDRNRAIKAGAGLVWCPSSNHYLLGQTASVAEFATAGLLALGSDSRLTADGDLLDELRAAHATGQITPLQLFRAVTIDAARLLRLPDMGALLPGYQPDFFIAPASDDPYLSLINLRPDDIEAVYVRGTPRYRRTANG
jgi:cytosine/adenosine deaminase-related metal-dependent hydrolase